MLMSHTIFITLLSILQPKGNMGVVSLLLFPILQSNSVIQLQRIVVVYSQDFAFLYAIVIPVIYIHVSFVQGHGPPVAVLSLGVGHPYRGGWSAHRCEE
jgi:hypothetical protein